MNFFLGLLENVPVICGGFTDQEKINKFCYTIKNNSQPVSELQFHRISSAAIRLTNHSLWITGGQKIDENNWNTTEIVSLNQPSRPGAELPIEIRDHCMVCKKKRPEFMAFWPYIKATNLDQRKFIFYH